MTFSGSKAVASAAAVALVLAASPQGVLAQGKEGRTSLQRQITIMEHVIDGLLVDTPYVLVSGSGETRGLYLKGYGVIFSADASLDFPGDWNDKAFRKLFHRGEPAPPDEEGELDEEELLQVRRLRGIKQEMKELLGEYGPTLRDLADGEKVGIALFLDGGIFDRGRARGLLIEASRADLKRFAAGELDEKGLDARIVLTDLE